MPDEFSFLPDNAAEAGLPFDAGRPPAVRRESVPVPSGGTVSALVWGDGPPELALLHGGAQNAHTWDTTALALDRPLVALDLPGHGHSSWRPSHDYRPTAIADDVAAALAVLAPAATTLVGMSLGGLTALAVLARHPARARRLGLVDITPGVDRGKAAAVLAFVSGPARFDSFEAMVERTVAHHPGRSRSSLVRGVRHNARENEDGSWSWRYDRPPADRQLHAEDTAELWDTVAALAHPLLVVRGSASPVVSDDDVAHLHSLRPDAGVAVVADAGHSVQGDRPVELAGLLAGFHAGPP
jgi:pimeloyl-ACP methyl ester carboxylesterase